MNSRMTLAARTVLLTAGVVLGLYWYTSEPAIQARVSPFQQEVGQPFRYSDSTEQAKSWQWEFGNGQVSRQTKGLFYYYEPGTYWIRLTVNKKITRLFSVVVRPRTLATGLDSLVRIQGPKSGYEREKLVFTAVGGQARQFTWRFGESGQIDSREQTAIYSYPAVDSYTKPRTYTIELMTDVNKYPIRQQVTIFRGYNKFAPVVDSLDVIGNDIRKRLQSIADGQSFNDHYNYLLAKYLCRRSSAPVRVNSTKANDFYSYCMGLQFDKGVRIDAVAVTADSLTSCVLHLNVTQHKP